jgi:hypothetical protein
MSANVSLQGAGLKFHAETDIDNTTIHKILHKLEIPTELEVNLKIDDVELSIKSTSDFRNADMKPTDNLTICFVESKNCQKVQQNDIDKLIELISSNEKVTIALANIEVELITKGNFESLLLKYVLERPFEVNGMMTERSQGSFAKFEIHGNTSIEELKKLDDDGDYYDGDIVTNLKQFDASLCLGQECVSIKGCSENLCNDQSKPTFPEFKTTSKPSTNNKNSRSVGLGVGMSFIIALTGFGVGLYIYRKKKNESRTLLTQQSYNEFENVNL